MISSSYLELAHFFAGFNIHEGIRQAFISLEEIIVKDYDCKGLVAVSIPNTKDALLDRVRVVWGKKEYNNIIYKNIIKKEFVDGGKGSQKNNIFAELDGEYYSCIFVSHKTKQSHWLILRTEKKLEDEFVSLLSTFFNKCVLGDEKYQEIKRVENLVYVDEVTELFNQRKLLIDIESSIEQFEKNKESFSVLFMDIDHFKKVNDAHGHLVGTKVLEIMGKLLKDTFRENDLLYRYGGDEFVAIIPHINKEAALILGNRILTTVKEHKFIAKLESGESYEMSLSISIGVALYPGDATSKKDILNIADAMMYKAKESGRGRVCFVSDII
jgi:diguanylate cyclase (GGDEF)-like protein